MPQPIAFLHHSHCVGFLIVLVIEFHVSSALSCTGLLELNDVAVVTHEFIKRCDCAS
jgi:hypothetical protein